MKNIRKLLNILYKWSGWVAAFFIAAICLLVICQVALNAIDRISTIIFGSAVGLTIPSYADFTGFFLAAASFLALAHSLKDGAHIRVTLLFTQLPNKIRYILEGWSLLFAAAVSIYFTWYTAGLTFESFSYNDLSSGMIAVPLWIPQSAMLIGLAILSIALVDEFICLLIGKTPSYAKDLKENKEELELMSKTANPKG